MIRPVRMKKVACYPVGCDPVEAVSQYPVAEFKLDRCIIDYVTGEEMDAVLPAANSKSVDYIDGSTRWVGADTPRHTGTGVELCGQFTQLNPYSEAIDNWSNGTNTTLTPSTDIPVGFTEAWRVTSPATGLSFIQVPYACTVGVEYTLTWRMKKISENNRVDVKFGDSAFETFYAPDEWTRYSFKATAVGTGAPFFFNDGDSFISDILITDVNLVASPCVLPSVSTNGTTKTFPTESGAADNGISADFDKFPEIKAMLESGEGRIHWEGSFGFNKADVTEVINLLSTDGDPWSVLFLSASGGFRAISGTTAVNDAAFSAGDFIEADVVYSYLTGKFRIDVTVNGTKTVGTEYDFAGWDLSLDKIVEAWSFPDGLSMKIGPKRSYVEGVA